ncbi:MAG: pentapeptide repeat-containing protein [Blastocatellia bacterium]|nr:pentapeptide repeat-containing protein [Blastocatellia bacterium]
MPKEKKRKRAQPISTVEKSRIGKSGKLLKGLTEFFKEAAEWTGKKGDFVKAIDEAVPWVGDYVLEPAAEALPPLKFLSKLIEKIAEINEPQSLGILACTIAFERAIQLAVNAHPGPEGALRQAERQLEEMEAGEDVDLLDFSFETADSHPFTRRALALARTAFAAAGYASAQTDALLDEIRDSFPLCLDRLVHHRETREKFAPWTSYVQSGASGRHRARLALKQHQFFQEWLFERAPMLGYSPFPLSRIYLQPECSEFRWKDLNARGPARPDPFLVPETERKDLAERVWHYLLAPNVKTPIIIQGVAGTGKSSFTLRLCRELRLQGLRPIRIRLRKLRLDRIEDVQAALESAVELTSEEHSPDDSASERGRLFLDGAIFRETATRHEHICRYVLILDGWDEINIAHSSFQQRVADLLRFIQDRYLSAWAPRVRVILTGRPSTDVTASEMLDPETPILTIQSLRPAQIEWYVREIARAVAEQPALVADTAWPAFDPARLDELLERYAEDFRIEQASLKNSAHREAGSHGGTSSLSILGLPLLAHLIVRLIAEWQTVEPDDLIVNPAKLYRNLINLTCEKSGQPDDANLPSHDLAEAARFRGEKLRGLLHKTAAAMSVAGKDAISAYELALRLGWSVAALDREASGAVESNSLASLMISYYFKGGFDHLGCEFIHKSFREYLFAEAIIESLKRYGAKALQKRALVTRPLQTDTDFFAADPRCGLSRELARLLGPQWMSEEVGLYLADLVVWDIQRSAGNAQEETGLQTIALPLEGWKLVRDALADLWKWWGDGNHLRLYPIERTDGGPLYYTETVAAEVARYAAPMASQELPAALQSSAETDSRLGAGLFRLCSLVHSYLALSEGWLHPREGKRFVEAGDLWGSALDFWEDSRSSNLAFRDYQTEVKLGDRTITLFAPSARKPDLFYHLAARINATPGRPQGFFPQKESMSCLDLKDACLSGLFFEGADLGNSRLDGVDASRAGFESVNFDQAHIADATFNRALFTQASFVSVRFANSTIIDSDFSLARMDRTVFDGGELGRSNFSRANLNGCVFREVDLEGVNFDGTQFVDGDLRLARGLHREQLRQAALNRNVQLPEDMPDAASLLSSKAEDEQTGNLSNVEALLNQLLNRS